MDFQRLSKKWCAGGDDLSRLPALLSDRDPLSKWKGCTIFKPNNKEATDLTGRTQWKEQAKHLQNELECGQTNKKFIINNT